MVIGQQVKSYFSRLSVLQKRGKLKLINHGKEEEENEEIEMMEEALKRQSLLDCVREEVDL